MTPTATVTLYFSLPTEDIGGRIPCLAEMLSMLSACVLISTSPVVVMIAPPSTVTFADGFDTPMTNAMAALYAQTRASVLAFAYRPTLAATMLVPVPTVMVPSAVEIAIPPTSLIENVVAA